MIVLAFCVLGFLIGNLVGLTAGTITASIVPLLFAFGGGSAIAFLQKINSEDRRAAAGAILALSVGCLLGVYGGLFVSERQLLTPQEYRGARAAQLTGPRYLRSETIDAAHAIDQRLYSGEVTIATLEEAYQQMYELVTGGTR